jgi:adenosylhomocysteine nucleosidase
VSHIGIVVALPQEAGMWTTVRPSCGDLLALSPDLHLVVSGIGGANAQAAATRLLEMNCDALVSWGTAGALHPDLRSGQLVVADQITDTSGERLTPDPAWAQRVVARLASHGEVLVAGVAGTNRILDSVQAKRALGAASGAAIVDMESAALARVAAKHGIPLLVLRAVVDELDTVIPASIMAATDAQGRVRIARLSMRVLGRPPEWLGVWRLGRAFGRARRSLGTAARSLRPDLALFASSPGA